jgi:transcription initiation factor TFIIH subunit 2
MPDSDDEYVQDASDDDIGAFQVTRDTEKAKAIQASKSRKDERDFEVTRTWENVVEGEDGTISSAVEGMMDAGKRQR